MEKEWSRDIGWYLVREWSYSDWIKSYWDGYVFIYNEETFQEYNLYDIIETPISSLYDV